MIKREGEITISLQRRDRASTIDVVNGQVAEVHKTGHCSQKLDGDWIAKSNSPRTERTVRLGDVD